jgi:hypothetical protein
MAHERFHHTRTTTGWHPIPVSKHAQMPSRKSEGLPIKLTAAEAGFLVAPFPFPFPFPFPLFSTIVAQLSAYGPSGNVPLLNVFCLD